MVREAVIVVDISRMFSRLTLSIQQMNYILTFVCSLGFLLVFLSSIIKNRNTNSTQISYRIYFGENIYSFRDSITVSLAISLYIIITVVFDIFCGVRYFFDRWIHRILLLFSIMAPSALILYLYFYPIHFVIINNIFSARAIVRTTLALAYLRTFDYNEWPIKNNIAAILCCTIGHVLSSNSNTHSLLVFYLIVTLSVAFHIIAIILIFSLLSFLRKNEITSNQVQFRGVLWSQMVYIFMSLYVILCALQLVIDFNRYMINNVNILIVYSIMVYLELLLVVLLLALHSNRIEWEFLQIQNALELKRVFVRFVSHEIRTPLNTVFLGLKLLRNEIENYESNNSNINININNSSFRSNNSNLNSSNGKNSNMNNHHHHHKHNHWVDIVADTQQSADIALSLVNDLLTYEKLEAGLLQLELETLVVWDVLDETIRPLFIQAREAGVEIVLSKSLQLLKELHTVADRLKISQIIRNIVSNALKFSSHHTNSKIVFDAKLESLENKQHHHLRQLHHRQQPPVIPDNVARGHNEETMFLLKLTVKDSGPGISKSDQSRLFKDIVQFSPGKLQNGGGSGLGLWISQRIALLHGGELSVESEGLGCGSAFTISLPVSFLPDSIPPITSRISGDALDGYRDRARESFRDRSKENSSTDKCLLTSSRHTTTAGGSGKLNGSGKHKGSGKHTMNTSSHRGLNELRSCDSIHSFRRVSVSLHRNSSPGGHKYNLDKLSVLLVDDSAMNRKMMARLLQLSTVCEVKAEAADGVLAVKEIQMSLDRGDSYSFDVILMDNVMPNLDGQSAAKIIRSLGWRGIIVGITGNALPDQISDFLAHGVDCVLTKPVDMTVLERTISDIRAKKEVLAL